MSSPLCMNNNMGDNMLTRYDNYGAYHADNKDILWEEWTAMVDIGTPDEEFDLYCMSCYANHLQRCLKEQDALIETLAS